MRWLASLLIASMASTQSPSTQPSTPTPSTEPVGLEPETPSRETRTGAYALRFTERSELSALPTLRKRLGWQQKEIDAHDPDHGTYDIADQSFQVWVPADYDPATPHGLLVWVSPAETGRIPAAWPAALAAHHLIVIGADRSGNDEFVWRRMALALDAAHGAMQTYNVDSDRVYVTGFSGGGKLASGLGLHFADRFRGGIYQGGCNHYRAIPRPEDRTFEWPARLPKPSGTQWRLTRRESRHVILNGADDPNRIHAELVAADWREHDRFAHVTVLTMPDVGHTTADTTTLDAALRALDAPLLAARAAAREDR